MPQKHLSGSQRDTQKSKSWKVRQSKANRSLWPPLFPDLNFLLLWGQTGKKVALRLFFLAMPFKAFTYIFKTKKGDPLWSSIRFLDQTPFSTPIFGAWLFWGVIEGSELLLWVVRFQPPVGFWGQKSPRKSWVFRNPYWFLCPIWVSGHAFDDAWPV